MGKANKERRKAKRRDRTRRHEHRRYEWAPPRPSAGAEPREPIFEIDVETALLVAAEGAAVNAAINEAHLEPLQRARPAAVARTLAGLLERNVKSVWDRGWQPADLDRAAGRDLERSAHQIVCAAVRFESVHYAAFGREVEPRWMAQVDALASPTTAAPLPPGGDPWLLWWATAELLDWRDALIAGVSALGFVMRLPSIPAIGLPPRSWHRGGRATGEPVKAGGADDKVLARVRALLAKAEATTFEEEAAAFMAKAQELMTRHRIDRLMLVDPEQTEEVSGCRISTDDPYAGAKALLLGAVARANGCRAVWSREHGFSTVFGRAPDLDSVDLLFTSLLVQATTALTVAGTDRRTRSRSFRQSFLVGFTSRIRERLAAGVQAATAEAEAVHGVCLLPVLARNDAAIEDAVHLACPSTTSFGIGARDGSGWQAGRVAGELADITGPRLPLEAV